ncbi:MAG: response regulator transcription factor, partial [Sulfitobacter sp. SK025]
MKLDIPSLSEAVATPAVASLVLVVEGDGTRRACLSAALKGWGYEVASAASEAEALALCTQRWPDIVLCSGAISGLDFCRVFWELSQGRGSYVILLADSHEWAVDRALDAGADDVLLRPAGLPELRARLMAGGAFSGHAAGVDAEKPADHRDFGYSA